MANIYMGHGSCYARNEGIYVSGNGVDFSSAVAIAYLILRDYRRGYTYNHRCQRIPMTKTLAVKRLNYLYPLALKHYGMDEAEKVRELILDIYANGFRMPSKYLPVLYYSGRLHGLPIAYKVREAKRKIPVLVYH